VLESVSGINRTSSQPSRIKRLSLEDDVHRTRFIRVAGISFPPDVPLFLLHIDAGPMIFRATFAKFVDQVINMGASNQFQALILVGHGLPLGLLLHEGRKVILTQVHPGFLDLIPGGVVARSRRSLEESIADIEQVCVFVDLGGDTEAS
jgi:hypothetical protein